MTRLLLGTALMLVITSPGLTQAKKALPKDKQVAELIVKLGDASFEVRRDAHRALVEIGKPALPQLRKAAEGPDAEIQLRARRIIKEIENQQVIQKSRV